MFARSQSWCRPVLQSTTQTKGLQSFSNSAAVSNAGQVQHGTSWNLLRGVCKVTQLVSACLQSSTQPEGLQSTPNSAALHQCWAKAAWYKLDLACMCCKVTRLVPACSALSQAKACCLSSTGLFCNSAGQKQRVVMTKYA